MLYKSDNIEYPAENFKYLLKVLSMFKISIIYDETIYNKDIQKAVGIMCINCGKSIGCSLDNQNIKLYHHFFQKIVFCHTGLSLIIQSNKSLIFDFQNHFPSWIIIGPWYNTMICSIFYGSLFEDYCTTDKCDKYNIIFSIEAHAKSRYW